MSTKRKVSTQEFLARHPVFSLAEAAEALAVPGGRRGTSERLQYHVAAGRVKRLAREVFATVPAGVSPSTFQPDAFLVASTMRPDGIFSHHSALELLGAAHSTWNQVTLYSDRRRAPLSLGNLEIRFLNHPPPFKGEEPTLATRKVERGGRLLRTTGPERTLVEGFARPDLAGGLAELVVSAGGLPVLELETLRQVLALYDTRKLWAAVGWFLQTFQTTFHVPDDFLREVEAFRPSSPRYLLRNDRGGTLDRRWNLILPEDLTRMTEPNASSVSKSCSTSWNSPAG